MALADDIVALRDRALDDDLATAIATALATGDSAACARAGAGYTWERCTDQLVGNLVAVR